MLTMSVFVLPLLLLLSAASAQNYGSLCDDDGGGGVEYPPCNWAQLFLLCNTESGRCDCGEGGVYDGQLCRLKAQEVCDPPAGPTPTQPQPCVANAECADDDGAGSGEGSNFTCVCAPGFVVNSRQRCFLPHDAPCGHAPDHCDPDEWQQCSLPTNRCECRSRDNAAYNPVARTCQLLTDTPCLNPSPDDPIDGQPPQSCFTNSACSRTRGRCECAAGFETKGGSRKCFVQYANPCTRQSDCAEGVEGWQECDRVCRCANVTESVYNAEIEVCQLLSGASCGILSASQPCIPHAQCAEQSRLCTCAGGTQADGTSRRCHAQFGATCDPSRDLCNPTKFMECDGQSERCGCSQGAEARHDPTDGVCKLRAGSECARDGQPCIRDAACEAAPGGATPLRCRCQFDLESNVARECKLRHGRACSTLNDKCDTLSNLVCDAELQRCECNGRAWFDEIEGGGGRCTSFLDSQCSVDGQCPVHANCHLSACTCDGGFEAVTPTRCAKRYGATCDANSTTPHPECDPDSNLVCIGGLCLCAAGFVEEREGEGGGAPSCKAGHHAPCDQALVECSRSAGLRCIGGRCECLLPSDQLFQDDRCGSLVGRTCHLTPDTHPDAIHCVKNAECRERGWDAEDPALYGVCACAPGYGTSPANTCVQGTNAGVKLGPGNVLVSISLTFFFMLISHT